MYPDVSDVCDGCKSSKGSLGHTFWFGPEMVPFWHDVFKWCSKMSDLQIEPDALVALFGCSVASPALPHTVQQTVMLGMLVAKRIILSEWKATSAPCLSRWFMELVSGIHLEKLRSNTQGFHEKSESTWGPIYRNLNFPE